MINSNNFQIGDKVRVLTVEEMLNKPNAEEHSDPRFGRFIVFYDEEDNIEEQQFPISHPYTELNDNVYTIKDILEDGSIDLLEDEYIGYTVSKHMLVK